MRIQGMVLLLAFGCGLLPARDTATSVLSVTVRPAVALAAEGPDEVTVKIRLEAGASAAVWRAEECALPAANARRIESSGTYPIRLPGSGANACVLSSDGVLRRSVRLPVRRNPVLTHVE